MPRLTGFPYDEARKLFAPHCKSGVPRCQAFAKHKLRKLREEGGMDDPAIVAAAQCSYSAREGGHNVCWIHGAGKKGGPTGGRPLEHGRYSKFLPEELRERYADALADPGLIELREEMALVVTLIEDVLRQYGDQPPNLNEMADAIDGLGGALLVGDVSVAQDEFLRLTEVFQSGKGQWAVWGEVVKLIEQRRKLASSEVTRLQALHQMLTVQQAMALLAAMGDIFTHVWGALEQYHCPDCGGALSTDDIRRLRSAAAEKLRLLATRSAALAETDG